MRCEAVSYLVLPLSPMPLPHILLMQKYQKPPIYLCHPLPTSSYISLHLPTCQKYDSRHHQKTMTGTHEIKLTKYARNSLEARICLLSERTIWQQPVVDAATTLPVPAQTLATPCIAPSWALLRSFGQLPILRKVRRSINFRTKKPVKWLLDSKQFESKGLANGS